MSNIFTTLTGRTPRHRQGRRAGKKIVASLAAALLIVTGLTLPTLPALAEEAPSVVQLERTDAPPVEDAGTPAPTPADQAPSAEAPAEDTPAEDTPAEDTPSAEAPVEDAPAAEAPAQDAQAESAFGPVAMSAPGGTAVLTTAIVPVDHLTGNAQSNAAYNLHGGNVGYRVSYSCAVSACENVTVRLAPSQASPYFPAAQVGTLLRYTSWTAPFVGASIAGDDTSGKLVNLGTLTPGTAGTFLVVYGIAGSSSYTTASPAQYFPSGFQLQNSATIDASTAGATATATAAPVTWSSAVPNPSQSITSPGTVAPEEVVSYRVYMGSGAFIPAGSGRIAGTPQFVGAGSYVVVDQLPAEAEYVSSNGGGVYDAATHTVTWTRGSALAPDPNTIGGWGSAAQSGWTTRGEYTPRTVSIRYPGSRFAGATNGCEFTQSVSHTVTSTLSYLDPARTSKSVSGTMAHTVSCYLPFGAATVAKDSTNHASSGTTRLVNVPKTDTPNAFYWAVETVNRGNVPGVAVVTDNTLDQANAPVHRINTTATTPVPTIAYRYVCQAADPLTGLRDISGTAQSTDISLTTAQRAAGCRYASAEVTSGPIAPNRVSPSDPTAGTPFRVHYNYTVSKDAPIGQNRTNTASATMGYPNQVIADVTLAPVSRTIRFRATPDVVPPGTPKPAFASSFAAPAAVDGGGAVVPGRSVSFTVRGTTANIPAGVSITPEYVFLAPAGWVITPGSASFATGSVPAGVDFSYRTATVAGVDRQLVVAKWPNDVAFGSNVAWPIMTVSGSPTTLVAPGTTSVANAWMGDSRESYDNVAATYGGAQQNTADVAGDGATEQWFASSAQNVLVSSSDGLVVLKEICLPDAGASDGCEWIADPSRAVPVPVDAASIRYRISLQNTGNTQLGSVVAYDVLPYIGDTGLIPSTAGTPRGSDFAQTLTGVSAVSPQLTLAYSASTNPARPEVSPAGVDNDWTASLTGKQAIRATVNGTLAANQVVSFTYTAAVGAGATADSTACNSVAVASDRTLPSEPQAVCATTAEADLEAGGVATVDVQLGRPSLFPFTFENLGGSQSAPAEVTVDVPAGATVTGSPSGWSCSSAFPLVGPATLVCAPAANLEKDAPVTFELPVIVTTSGIAISAAVSGAMVDPDGDNNEHTITVPSAAAVAGGLGVVKSDGLAAVVAGQTATYSITVTNPLEFESLGGVTVTDALPAGVQFVSATAGGTVTGGVVSWTIPTIGPAADAVVAVTVLVLDSAPSSIVNTASASAVDPGFPSATLSGSGSDTDAVDKLTLTKTASLAGAASPQPGDVVTYTFVATNSGGGVVSGVQITDPMPGLSAISVLSWPALPGYLGAGQSVTARATYTMTAADVDAGTLSNTASVTGDSVGGGRTSASATATMTLPGTPAISLVKTAALGSPIPKPTELVSYTFTVTNTGNVSLSGVAISDQLAGLSTITFGPWPGTPGTLAAGQAVTATATYPLGTADLDRGSLVNTATATGVPPVGTPVSSTDDVTVLLPANAALTLDKSGMQADPSGTVPGDTITYSFTATNAGNVTLTGVAIADPLSGLSALNYAWPGAAGVLAPGEEVTATATYVTTQDDVDAGGVDNTATVSGTGVDSSTAEAIASTSVPIPADPRLSLVKSGAVASVMPAPGDLVTYSFEVENAGSITVSSVAISDGLTGLSAIDYGAWPGAAGRLAPGERVTATATYPLTQADIDLGRVENTATAAGIAPGDDPVSTIDSATVNLLGAPAIEFSKTADIAAGTPVAGDAVDYAFEIRNSGNVTMSGVGITDALVGLSEITYGAWPTTSGVLAPGQSVTASATYAITQADLDAGTVMNRATATGTGARGGSATADDGVTIALPAAPALSLDKSVALDADGDPAAGDTVTFSFEVANTGNVTVSGITLLDDMPQLSAIEFGAWPGAAAVLAPGESVTATAGYTLTQDDLDTGTVFNDATASGTPARGDLDAAVDSVTLVVPAAPALAFTKTVEVADDARPLAGQAARFLFEIENTGTTTVTGITIADEFDGLSAIEFGAWPKDDGVLAPGEKVSAEAGYTLTQADIDAGEIINLASVSGAPVRGGALEVEAEATAVLAPVPGLSIVKHAETQDANGDGFANPGERIAYSFQVANTGNVTLSDAVVTDPKVSGIPAIRTIAPGETVTVAADDYIVTAADGAEGTVVNTASASAVAPDGSAVAAGTSTTTTKAGLLPDVPGKPEVPGTDEPGNPAAPGTPGDGSGLAHTGFTGGAIALIAGILLFAGSVLLGVLAIRRRRGSSTE